MDTLLRYYTNGADPVQTPLNGTCGQCQYCSFTGLSKQTKVKMKTPTRVAGIRNYL